MTEQSAAASALVSAVTAALAVAYVLPGRPGPRRLVSRRGLFTGRWALPTGFKAKPVPSAARRLHRRAATVVAVACLLLLGLPWGLGLAGLAYFGIPVALSRLEPAAVRRRSERIVADLPLAVDLLAACLRAGRPPQAAVGTVSRALSGPLAELLAEVEHRLNLGTDPIDAWSGVLAEPACASLARAVQRALRSGTPLARTLEHLAGDARLARRWSAEEQARTIETTSVLPLGICFLPAFILLGVVPTIASSLTGLLDQFT